MTLGASTVRDTPPGRFAPWLVLVVYTALAAVATWPLLRDMRTTIASDAGDPLLNTSILVWNATTRPFSEAWWNAPHYAPTTGVASFTENLMGISPFASPVYWLTGNAFLAYNLSVFITWPLSAIAAFLLVRHLTGRSDAAFLAGLAFGFSPYRAVGLGHLQTLATFGVPLMLLGMHAYLRGRAWPWLLLVALAWLQQSYANGYYVLYGGLIAGLWLLYFGTRRSAWRAGLALVATLAVASLPLVPMLLRYRAIHEQYGLRRTFNEILYFSALPASWLEVGEDVWLWHRFLPNGKDNLFPGLTIVLLALAGTVWHLWRRTPADTANGAAIRTAPHIPRWLPATLWVLTACGFVGMILSLTYGQIDTTVAGIPFKMRDITRALAAFLVGAVGLAALTPRIRTAWHTRSPLLFYAVATLLVALLSCGAQLRVGDEVIWSPAPYGWLMTLPGFSELRVPTQLKMIDLLCLAVAAGLGYHALRPRAPRPATLALVALSVAIMADGWISEVRMAPAPEMWPIVEAPERTEPLLELPLGPDGDFAATYRAAVHHRRVMNGVSGYDPPHYVALKAGLSAFDPALLTAIASLGPIDIVVNGQSDPDGRHDGYAANAPGAVRVANDGVRTIYRVPRAPSPPTLGPVLPIARVSAARGQADAALMMDGRLETGWGDYPQAPDAWVIADLGTVQRVGGVTNVIGEYLLDFPRRLAIDLSLDGDTWTPAWEGPTFAQTFIGFVLDPTRAALEFPFAAAPARYVRLRQLESFRSMWRVSELRVHGPSPQLPQP